MKIVNCMLTGKIEEAHRLHREMDAVTTSSTSSSGMINQVVVAVKQSANVPITTSSCSSSSFLPSIHNSSSSGQVAINNNNNYNFVNHGNNMNSNNNDSSQHMHIIPSEHSGNNNISIGRVYLPNDMMQPLLSAFQRNLFGSVLYYGIDNEVKYVISDIDYIKGGSASLPSSSSINTAGAVPSSGYFASVFR